MSVWPERKSVWLSNPSHNVAHPFKAFAEIKHARQAASAVLAMRVLQIRSHNISLALRPALVFRAL